VWSCYQPSHISSRGSNKDFKKAGFPESVFAGRKETGVGLIMEFLSV
jgi:hypothetical protein